MLGCSIAPFLSAGGAAAAEGAGSEEAPSSRRGAVGFVTWRRYDIWFGVANGQVELLMCLIDSHVYVIYQNLDFVYGLCVWNMYMFDFRRIFLFQSKTLIFVMVKSLGLQSFPLLLFHQWHFDRCWRVPIDHWPFHCATIAYRFGIRNESGMGKPMNLALVAQLLVCPTR